MASPPDWGSNRAARRTWWRNWSSFAGAKPSICGATDASRPTSSSALSRTPPWSGTRNAHLEQFLKPVKVVVWAHNTHLGDARATQMSERGELNLGQLVREKFGHDAVAVGFTTHSGTVTAAREWDAPALRRRVRPAATGSYEALFHDAGYARFWLEFGKHPEVAFNLRCQRLERAIGVIYRPETEMVSHYYSARLPDQFDAVLHFDHTRGVEPLESSGVWRADEVEETFPTGL
jgi:hypothetical protein